jgi:ssRNA-specific RNase YbeY (16S rRNA maturation enzyme)
VVYRFQDAFVRLKKADVVICKEQMREINDLYTSKQEPTDIKTFLNDPGQYDFDGEYAPLPQKGRVQRSAHLDNFLSSLEWT